MVTPPDQLLETLFTKTTTICETRMHSSRMRTGRTLTVFWCLVQGGGIPKESRNQKKNSKKKKNWGYPLNPPCNPPLTTPPRGVPAWSQGGCTCLVPGEGGAPAWSRGGCTCLVPRGVPAWSWGVYLPGTGGCLLPGGVPAWSGGLPGQVLPPL